MLSQNDQSYFEFKVLNFTGIYNKVALVRHISSEQREPWSESFLFEHDLGDTLKPLSNFFPN